MLLCSIFSSLHICTIVGFFFISTDSIKMVKMILLCRKIIYVKSIVHGLSEYTLMTLHRTHHGRIFTLQAWQHCVLCSMRFCSGGRQNMWTRQTCIMYSLKERVFFVKSYYSTQKNLKEILHLCREQFNVPCHKWPSKSVIIT